MAITWNKQGLRYITCVKLTTKYSDGGVQTRNLYACDETAPTGWQDPDTGDNYEPRLKSLRVDYNLGGFGLNHRNGLLQEVCTFGFNVGGYDDTTLWTDFIGGDAMNSRLNSMSVTVFCVDLDDGEVTYVHTGTVSGAPSKFAPNSTVSIKSLGGHHLLHDRLLMEVYPSADFEDGSELYSMNIETTNGPGRVIPWAYGEANRCEGTVVIEGTGTTAGLTGQDDRGICFSARPSPSAIGDPVCTYKDTSDNSILATITRDAGQDDLTYTGFSSGNNMPYIVVTLGSSTTGRCKQDNSEDDSIWGTIGYGTEDFAKFFNEMLFNTTGWTYLNDVDTAEAKDSTVYADWAADPGDYNFKGVIPSPQKKNQTTERVPIFKELLAEALYSCGSDAWWEYGSSGARTWYFEKRDTSARHPAGSFPAEATWSKKDIISDSLVLRVDPFNDYGNELTASGPDILSAWNVTDKVVPELITGGTIYTESTETSGGLNNHKRRSVTFRWLAVYSPAVSYQSEAAAQEHIYFEWGAPIQKMGTNLHDLITFDVDNFPNTSCQIRRKTVDFTKGTIRFLATTASGVYS